MKFPSVVSDIMHEIITIDGETQVEEAAQKMLENKIGSIIVTEKGKPVGILTKTDMIARIIVANNDPKLYLTGSIMSTPLISIENDTSILASMRFIRDNDIHQVLVEDQGELVGIVSRGDLIRAVTLSSLAQFSSILRKK